LGERGAQSRRPVVTRGTESPLFSRCAASLTPWLSCKSLGMSEVWRWDLVLPGPRRRGQESLCGTFPPHSQALARVVTIWEGRSAGGRTRTGTGSPPGDFESHHRCFCKVLVGSELRCIFLAASGFRHQIQFILFQSASVFLVCFDLFVAPDWHQKRAMFVGDDALASPRQGIQAPRLALVFCLYWSHHGVPGTNARSRRFSPRG